MTDKKLNSISSVLLEWYDRYARELPWRGICDPYRTWVSETMLQQTRVETVIPYYNRFLTRFPTLPDLAAADESEVLKLWEGLGYYSRARNLLKGAREVMEKFQGSLPEDPAKLRKISGIGPYTAGAVSSIAFGLPVPAVDGNVIRVYSRVFGIRENLNLPSVRKSMETLVASAVPENRPGDYNQAVMDLGATICIPGAPECSRCPLSSFCDAFSCGDASDLPFIPGKSPPKKKNWTVPVIRSGSCVLLRRRSENLLNGLWCFPMLDCSLSELPSLLSEKFHIQAAVAGNPLHARHVFTHLIWEMDILPMKAAPDLSSPFDYSWIPWPDLRTLAFPTAMNTPLKAAEKLFSESI